MKKLLLCLIRFYQKHISPAFPPRCRFTPTCSQYALEAVERYGAWKGGVLALRRFCGATPFTGATILTRCRRPSGLCPADGIPTLEDNS